MRVSDVVAIAAAAVFAAGMAVLPDGGEPASEQVRARTVPVERTDVVCPRMPADGDHRAAVTVPDLGEQPDLERNPVRVMSDGSTLARIGSRGEVWRDDSDAIGGGITARATGALAAGLSGVVTSDLEGDASGLATAACVHPGSSWWFVGAGSSVSRDGALLLSNPSAGVAVVDLVFHGPDGVIEDAVGEQIALDVGERRRVRLEDVVPGVEDVAVEVRVTQGRVAAAMSETASELSRPVGADFIGSATAPDRQVAITGLPAGEGRRTLSVVNTGDSETVVDLEVLGASGAFAPTDFDVLRVPAGAVVTRDVSEIAGDEISGLRLSADQPITAAVRSTTADDISFAPAGRLLAGGAAAVPIPAGVEPTVVLSAVGDEPASAEITVFDADGKQIGRHVLQINGGQTSAWRVRGDGRPASVVVTSEQGEQLIGAVRWSGDAGESGTPLLPLRTTLTQPALTYDPDGS